MMRRRVKITGHRAGHARRDRPRRVFMPGINEPHQPRRGDHRFDPRQRRPLRRGRDPRLPHQRSGFLDHRESQRIPRQTQFAIAGAACSPWPTPGWTWSRLLRGSDPVVVNGSSLPDPELTYRTIAGVDDSRAPALRGAGGDLRRSSPERDRERHREDAGHPVPHDRPPERVLLGPRRDRPRRGDDQPAGRPISPSAAAPRRRSSTSPCSSSGSQSCRPGTRAKPTEMGRPFDLWRNTGVIGEGACVVLLEAEDSPRPGYAWVGGYAYGNDDGDVPGQRAHDDDADGAGECAAAFRPRWTSSTRGAQATCRSTRSRPRASASSLESGSRMLPAVSLKGADREIPSGRPGASRSRARRSRFGQGAYRPP
jgi:hypothetical protein